MIDLTNGNNDSRFTPDLYIKTKSGSVLAIIKLLEAIAACIGIIGLFIGQAGVSSISNQITDAINDVNISIPSLPVQLAGNLSRFSFLIPVFLLMLIVLDGIGTFMMRYANSGEGIVRFVHILCWIGKIIEIIFFIIGVIIYVFGLNYLIDKSGGSSSFTLLSGVLGIFLYPVLAVSFAVLLFLCGYHHDICTVLKAVLQEKRSGYRTAIGNNNLMSRSGWFAWCSGIVFVFSAIIFIYPLVSHEELFTIETTKSNFTHGSTIILGINFLFCFLNFLKYLSLLICVRNFQKYHEPAMQKTSPFLWIILVILLCMASYSLGKNNGRKEILNQNSSKNTYETKTSTPVSREEGNSSTPAAGEIRRSLPTASPTPVPTGKPGNSGGVDPDLKEFLDGYEAFMDKYISFMKRYTANPTDLNLLVQYASMLSELDEFSEAADRYDAKQSEMSAADLAYYTAAMMRINNKLLSVY